jgi:hypothetical protein
MSTFDIHLRHHAGEDSREKTIPDPGLDRGLFMPSGARPPVLASRAA